MVINNVAVNQIILKKFLVLVPRQTRELVQKLLSTVDPQDVTRAVELICAVANLCLLDISNFNPSKVRTVQALQLIGTLFYAMSEHFINHNLSLSWQMMLLSQYTHIALILYRQHGTSFMSNQLYSNSQVMVKSTFFYLAKQILMDLTLPVLLMLGDDRLENLFGRVCMQGAHNGWLQHKHAPRSKLVSLSCMFFAHGFVPLAVIRVAESLVATILGTFERLLSRVGALMT